MASAKKNYDELLLEVERLAGQISHYKTLEENSQGALRTLKEKEEFNFTLFQYIPVCTVVVDREGRVVKSNLAKRRSGDRLPKIGDVMYRDYASKHSTDMYGELMSCIASGDAKMFEELRYGAQILTVTIAPFPGGAIITSQDITVAKQAEADRIRLITELKRALDEVEKLRELLPICASCKKIRDDKGYWNQIEDYLSKRSPIIFSHTICPDCMQKHYPEYWDKISESHSAGKKSN